jgi:gamma-D-glutamyl-L-lysine dipeptidyl-peptidase
MDNSQASWGEHAVVYTGHIWDPTTNIAGSLKMVETAFQYINTPYLWGGKSVFGADCSGFTQKVFQFFNIPLLRDAWQQATQGSTINGLSESRFGDLAFFDNEEERITHVGILLDDSEIIHASGRVKVDKIDDQGIRDPGGPGHTHWLKLIKRYF